MSAVGMTKGLNSHYLSVSFLSVPKLSALRLHLSLIVENKRQGHPVRNFVLCPVILWVLSPHIHPTLIPVSHWTHPSAHAASFCYILLSPDSVPPVLSTHSEGCSWLLLKIWDEGNKHYLSKPLLETKYYPNSPADPKKEFPSAWLSSWSPLSSHNITRLSLHCLLLYLSCPKPYYNYFLNYSHLNIWGRGSLGYAHYSLNSIIQLTVSSDPPIKKISPQKELYLVSEPRHSNQSQFFKNKIFIYCTVKLILYTSLWI